MPSRKPRRIRPCTLKSLGLLRVRPFQQSSHDVRSFHCHAPPLLIEILISYKLGPLGGQNPQKKGAKVTKCAQLKSCSSKNLFLLLDYNFSVCTVSPNISIIDAKGW